MKIEVYCKTEGDITFNFELDCDAVDPEIILDVMRLAGDLGYTEVRVGAFGDGHEITKEIIAGAYYIEGFKELIFEYGNRGAEYVTTITNKD